MATCHGTWQHNRALGRLPCPVPRQTQTTRVHVVLLSSLFPCYLFHSPSLLSVSLYLVISLTKLRSLFFINKSNTNYILFTKEIRTGPVHMRGGAWCDNNSSLAFSISCSRPSTSRSISSGSTSSSLSGSVPGSLCGPLNQWHSSRNISRVQPTWSLDHAMEHCACLIRRTSPVSSPINSTSQSIRSRNAWFPDPPDPDFDGPATSWISSSATTTADFLTFFCFSPPRRDGLGLGLVHTGPGPSGLNLRPLAFLLETSAPARGVLFGLLRVLHAWHPELGAALCA